MMTPPQRYGRSLQWLRIGTLAALPMLASTAAHAGLLAEATRILYRADAPARTLTLTNTNAWPVVVQTWFDHGAGDPEVSPAPPFLAIPAVFRLAPGGVQTLRIVYTGEPLAPGRESVYWLNLYEIPPAVTAAAPPDDHDDHDGARLDLAINTQLKLFYRPPGLTDPANLADQLRFSLVEENGQWHIDCHNPTPWHASFAGLAIAGKAGDIHARPTPDMMTPPHTTRRYSLVPGQPEPDTQVWFNLIDDGGFSQGHSAKPSRQAVGFGSGWAARRKPQR